MKGKRAICPGCGNEIDSETCWCGDLIRNHTLDAGHVPVPMGCDCYRAWEPKPPPAWVRMILRCIRWLRRTLFEEGS